MAFELSDLDEVDATLVYLKSDGSDGTIDTSTQAPNVDSSDPRAATATVTSDGMSVTIKSGDNLAADTPVTITVHVDADLGTGMRALDIPIDIVVKSHTAGEVSTANVSFGSPRRKS